MTGGKMLINMQLIWQPLEQMADISGVLLEFLHSYVFGVGDRDIIPR